MYKQSIAANCDAIKIIFIRRCYGAVLFHYLVLIVTLKLWLHARYHTLVFVASALLSVLSYIFFNTIYSVVDV